MPTKPWYLSKGVWAGVIGLAIVIWNAVPTYIPSLVLPPVPEWLLGILAALGLYARVSADTRIS